MTKTRVKWFPPTVKPKKAGVYNTSRNPHLKGARTDLFSYWDGDTWRVATESIKDAFTCRKFEGSQDRYWRGLVGDKNEPLRICAG